MIQRGLKRSCVKICLEQYFKGQVNLIFQNYKNQKAHCFQLEFMLLSNAFRWSLEHHKHVNWIPVKTDYIYLNWHLRSGKAAMEFTCIILTFSRLGAIASNSSMKMILGEFFSASSKAFLRLLSDSPASLLIISGPLMRKKNDPVSLATALAIRVFPVPGGPKRRIPRGG